MRSSFLNVCVAFGSDVSQRADETITLQPFIMFEKSLVYAASVRVIFRTASVPDTRNNLPPTRGVLKSGSAGGLCLHNFIASDTCTMAEYNKLKSMLLDMQPRTFTDGEPNAMDQRRTLVDTMFKYIDRNQDGRLSSEELAEISIKEHLENILLECSMQDLLRYDDYNNDGHLTLQELYTAFRESHRRLTHHYPSVQISLSHHVANL
ncbi:Follistatin-related protein 4 [Anabarilius grahami]|uniref:Follistatin-related protein 4 n=1 Tax=Anabarilius grahami TaxID=495550 RepID=A0A3N0XUD2_ANAGA|nr:Follistatin-related protein 4 [Anabarilius grahami]